MRFPSNLVCESLVAYRLRIYINVDIFPPPPPPPPPLPPPPVLLIQKFLFQLIYWLFR